MVFLHYLLLLFHITIDVDALTDRCIYIDYDGKKTNVSGCSANPVCQQDYKITIITLPPFSLAESLTKAILQCCGPCTHFHIIHRFQNITELTPHAVRESDLILPFLALSSTRELHGYNFIPFIDITDALYITEQRQLRLFQSILELYPLMIICLLLALIAGYIIWLLETWYNEEEFPRDFLIGWYEGLWWSIVTMTTVGYGDKSPRSIAGRLFSILWIFIGLVLCGILTGTLTTEIMDANSPPPPHVKDMRVGALQYRDFEHMIIANKGGILVKTDGVDFYSDLILLIDKLRNNDIDGMVFDKYTLHYATYVLSLMYRNPRVFANSSQYPLTNEFVKSRIDYFMNETMRTDMPFIGEKLSYGIMMKNSQAYDYFRHTISDNRLRNKIEYDLQWNKIKKKFAAQKKGSFYSSLNVLFSPRNYYFQTSLKAITLMLIVICLFGVFYELKNGKLTRFGERYIKKKNADEEDEKEENESFLGRLKLLNPEY